MSHRQEYSGKVESVRITPWGTNTSVETESIQVFAGRGVQGDRHYGAHRLADVRERVLRQHGIQSGAEMANHRQFSLVCRSALATIGQALGLDGPVPYGLLGENLVVSGIPGVSKLPSGTLLFFESESGERRTAVLAVWGENLPCRHPGVEIERVFPGSEADARFTKAAFGRRGIVGSVYVSGKIKTGDHLTAVLPPTRV